MKPTQPLQDFLEPFLEKYEKLVWYTRSKSDSEKIADLRKELELFFPQETKNLKQPGGDWEHGFNSGVLASVRLVYDFLERGEDLAREDFPSLDT
jgi:hypothetical protein